MEGDVADANFTYNDSQTSEDGDALSTGTNELPSGNNDVGDDHDLFQHQGSSCHSASRNKKKKRSLDEEISDYIQFAKQNLQTPTAKTSEEDADDDLQFFKSLLPTVRKLSDSKKLEFRMAVMSSLQNVMYTNSVTPVQNYSPMMQFQAPPPPPLPTTTSYLQSCIPHSCMPNINE